MKLTTLKSVMAMLVVLFSLSAYAYDVEYNGIYYDLDRETMTASVTSGGSKYSGAVSIPSNIIGDDDCGYRVTSIGDDAFLRCSGLTSVSIPNSVTSIGDGAFWGSGLTAVSIPNSVTSIGSWAFSWCSDLTAITVASDNPIYNSRNNCNAIIGTSTNKLVAGCKNTTIPNSVTSIGDFAFEGCSGLTVVNIPNSVTYIGGFAFASCSGLTAVDIPNSVTYINQSAFEGCSGLTNVSISNSNIYISLDAFGDTPWYNNQPDGLIYAGRVAYKYKGTMPNNTSIIIKEGTTSINYGAFFGCSGLTAVSIPNSVTSIGSWAFSGCSGLTTVDIPNSVTSIGDGWFAIVYLETSKQPQTMKNT